MKQLRNKDGIMLQVLTEAMYGRSIMVVYQELKEPFQVYVIEKEKFDHWIQNEEQTNVKSPEKRRPVQEEKETRCEKKASQSVIERFLDANTYSGKIEVLESTEEFIDGNILDMMAASMDVLVEGDSIDEKYFSLMQILRTQAKFETNR